MLEERAVGVNANIDSFIQRQEETTVAAHKGMMGRVVWIILLLAVAIPIVWFRR
jgi:hypothetical protein